MHSSGCSHLPGRCTGLGTSALLLPTSTSTPAPGLLGLKVFNNKDGAGHPTLQAQGLSVTSKGDDVVSQPRALLLSHRKVESPVWLLLSPPWGLQTENTEGYNKILIS